MAQYKINKLFDLEEIPEYKRYKEMNKPLAHEHSEKMVATMYSHAIHWVSILKILWPDFEKWDHYIVEVAHLFDYDPDDPKLTESFYRQIAEYIANFWRIQLDDLFPIGEWEVVIDDDPEVTVEATIYSR